MKKFVSIFLLAISVMGICSCSQKEPKEWEYYTLEINAPRPTSGLEELNKFYSNSFAVPQAEMDTLGAEGWELVDVYTILETVHPNFGNKEYVTGLQPNTRTSAVCYVFKRPKTEVVKNEGTPVATEAVEDVDMVPVEAVATEPATEATPVTE